MNGDSLGAVTLAGPWNRPMSQIHTQKYFGSKADHCTPFWWVLYKLIKIWPIHLHMCAGPADPHVKIHKVPFIFLDQIRWMRYNLWFSQNYWMNVHKPLWKGEQWSDLEPKYFWVWIWLPGRFQGPPKVTAPSESPFIFLQWGWIDIQLLSAIWKFSSHFFVYHIIPCVYL